MTTSQPSPAVWSSRHRLEGLDYPAMPAIILQFATAPHAALHIIAMMSFREFKRRTARVKAKPKQERPAPTTQPTDQGNAAKNATMPDAEADGDVGIVLGVIEGIRLSNVDT